jgi:cytochrome c-type biogenesis protein CcmH/NrfG
MSDISIVDTGIAWSREQDGIAFTVETPSGPVDCIATRDALATLVGKDRSEVSADMAADLFERHRAQLATIVAAMLDRLPARTSRTPLVIGYDHITG